MLGIPTSRSRDFLELIVAYGLILIALWTPNAVQRVLFCIALAFMLAVTFLFRRADLRSLGLGLAGLRKSGWIVLAALALAGCGLLLAYRLRTLRIPYHVDPLGWHTWSYAAWSLLQQFILQDFFFVRLLRLLPSRTAAVTAAALLFATAHLPNPVLVPATLVWALVACALFLRYRDLYSLAAMHAVLGIALAMTIPNSISHQMRVGLGYFQYREPQYKLYLNQSNQMVSTDAWVIAEAISLRSWRHARP